jgi:hypothetical protein
MTRQASRREVVERHYYTVAAELLRPEQDSLLAAEVCGWCYGVVVEASLVSGTVVVAVAVAAAAVVAALHPRIHTASAVVEEVDHAVGEGMHVGSAAWTDQLSFLSNASCKDAHLLCSRHGAIRDWIVSARSLLLWLVPLLVRGLVLGRRSPLALILRSGRLIS